MPPSNQILTVDKTIALGGITGVSNYIVEDKSWCKVYRPKNNLQQYHFMHLLLWRWFSIDKLLTICVYTSCSNIGKYKLNRGILITEPRLPWWLMTDGLLSFLKLFVHKKYFHKLLHCSAPIISKAAAQDNWQKLLWRAAVYEKPTHAKLKAKTHLGRLQLPADYTVYAFY